MVLQTLAEPRFDPQETLAELVLRHPECAAVFQKHNLEFCCDGDRPLAQACRRRLLSIDQMIAELKSVAALPSRQVDPRRLPLDELLSSLEHQHTELAIWFPKLAERARTLADLAPRRPWLRELAWDLKDLTNALLPPSTPRGACSGAGPGPEALPDFRAASNARGWKRTTRSWERSSRISTSASIRSGATPTPAPRSGGSSPSSTRSKRS